MGHMNKKYLVFVLLSCSLFFLEGLVRAGIPLEMNPRGVAVNAITGIAVVPNEKSDSVSLIDLDTQRVISTVPVGRAPSGSAIDSGLNIAAITNSKDDTVSVIDLNTFSVINTIPVGKEPEGIAVNPASHEALVANHKDNTVAIIDLVNYGILRVIPVGREPKDTAIDVSLNMGLVANEKDHDISEIDLNTYEVTGIVSAGQKPTAIDVNSETNVAAVANEKDDSVMLINLETRETSVIEVCKHPVDIAINPLDNRALVVCDEDRSLLLIDLNTKSVVQEYALNKLPKSVAVDNFTNVAAVADDQTDNLMVMQLPNPVPKIFPPTPFEVYRGSGDENVVVSGSGFMRSSAVNCENRLLTTTFVDNHHLQATITKDLLVKAGSQSMSVENPAPAGGVSNKIAVAVVNPAPSISALDPMEAVAGLSTLSLAVYGSGFFDDTTFYMDGIARPFIPLRQTKLQVDLLSPDLETGGYIGITAMNPQPGGGISNQVVFTVLNPAPTLVSISPVSAVAGSPAFSLTLTGDNFVKTSAVSFNGERYSAIYRGKSQIEATIPASAVNTAGSHEVKVINPSPGGGESSPANFTVKQPLEIHITSPGDGETINRSAVIVKGTFKSETNDVGILVNGVIAEMRGNEWVANGVPLMTGTNTITATIDDSSGNSRADKVAVDTTDTLQHVRLAANMTSGIAPLNSHFSVRTEMANTVSSYQMDFDGDGITDYAGAAFDDINYTYTTEGIFYPEITITDNQGNTFSDTIAIAVLTKAEIEAVLKGKWEGMKDALKKKETGAALDYFIGSSWDRYRSLFEALKDQLPTILDTFVEFSIADVYDNIAEYEIVANEDGVLYSYPGVFVRDEKGIWKFRDF